MTRVEANFKKRAEERAAKERESKKTEAGAYSFGLLFGSSDRPFFNSDDPGGFQHSHIGATSAKPMSCPDGYPSLHSSAATASWILRMLRPPLMKLWASL